MLGAAAPFLGIEYTKLEQGIRDIFGKKGPEVVGMNILALEAGYDVAKKLL
jgi:indolepyruvate ferredoxin oxidoreductase beta subunit